MLGAEDIGLRVLPEIIPMLISASLSKEHFGKVIGTVRRLVDLIEEHRARELDELEQNTLSKKLDGGGGELPDLFGGEGS